MAQTLTSRKRLRKQFGSIGEVAEMPNLIEVQKASYDDFLMVKEPPGGRSDDFGLQSVFKGVFPISDFAGKSTLEFVSYEFEPPKFDTDECMQRDMTYAAPLKVKLRLIVFDINEETGSKSIKDVKEQDVYMGDMPLMTLNGTFIINGTERVIVSQMHRSPGVFFDHDRGKTHSSGKLLFAARIIPYRGSWLDFEFDAKDIVYVRIDRRRKLPVTTMLYALGLDDEQILAHFYKHIPIKESKRGWKMPYIPEKFRGGASIPLAEQIPAPRGGRSDHPKYQKKAEPAPGSISLNSASETEFQKLPGVGPATAKKIVEYRNAHGSFASVDELLAVKGIGPKKLAAMRKFLRL